MLKSGFIKNFTILAGVLSDFLYRVSQGICPAMAFKDSGAVMHSSGAHRILKRFRDRQAHIRTLLTRINDPPDLTDHDPVMQTIIHLRTVFKGCMVSQFQQYFQVSFL